MARKKKQAKSKRARASVVRQDYRKGGRVRLHGGGLEGVPAFNHTPPSEGEFIGSGDIHTEKADYQAALSAHTAGLEAHRAAVDAAKKTKEETEVVQQEEETEEALTTPVGGDPANPESDFLSWADPETAIPTTGEFKSGDIGIIGGAVQTPKADVDTLTSQGVDEKGVPIEGAVERGITADEDVQQISRFEIEYDSSGEPKRDTSGRIIIKKDADGNPILKSRVSQPTETVAVDDMTVDDAGSGAIAGLYEPQVDEEGNPIPGSIKRDKDGQPVPIKGLDAATYEAVKAAAFPEGYSETPPDDLVYPAVMPPDGMKWIYGPTGNRIAIPEAAVSMDINPETGTLSEEAKTKVDELRRLTERAVAAKRDIGAEEKALARDVPAIISDGAYVGEVDGIGGEVSPTPDAEVKTRTAITGTHPTADEAQIINNIGFEAAQRSAVQGRERTGAAATMLAETSEIPEEIAAAIVEDPATGEAQIANEDVTVQAAIAALPPEALMSAQLESLVGGLEEGTIPIWARPAVDQVTQMMAQRGLNVSTVARDSLFNAIIQSALPIAQNNSQALQARAAQNLSNQQQANLTEAQQEQQLRMQNLANRQEAASETAQMAQQMRLTQSQFNQQARMTTAQQQQQTRLQNLENRQNATLLNAQNEQAMAVQNLGAGLQMDLANLEVLNETERENMSAEQQGRLLKYQTAAHFINQNAAFTQEMNKANLSAAQQIQLANLTALNQASSENLNAEQQTELANLNKQMQTNLRNAELAQNMGIAQLNVDQQRAMQNATMVANMDMAKYTTKQQVEIANSKFMQTMTLTDFNARQQEAIQNATAMASLDMAAVDQRTKIAIENARNFLQVDMANINNTQQGIIMEGQLKQQRLLSDQAATNASQQFNATSENQTNQFITGLGVQVSQFNAQQKNAMSQFNTTEQNRMAAIEAGNQLEADKFNNQLSTQIEQYNTSLDYQRDQWNAANAQAVEQSNVAWRRQANTIDTAAKNAVNQQNSMNAFNLTRDSQNALWQELRDNATYDWQGGQNQLDRLSRMLSTALSNDAIKANDSLGWGQGNLKEIFDMFTDAD